MFERLIVAIQAIGFLIVAFFAVLGFVARDDLLLPCVIIGAVFSIPFFGVAWILSGKSKR